MPFAILLAIPTIVSSLQVARDLPVPTGPRSVGTQLVHAVDSSRTSPVGFGPRSLTIQLWYPARASTTGRRARYIWEDGVRDVVFAGYYEQLPNDLKEWGNIKVAAFEDAEPVGGRHPLVLFSHGLGIVRANYTFLAQELASHGYVVAMLDHPFGGVTQTGDGRLIRLADDSTFVESEDHVGRMEQEWGADIVFVRRWLLQPAVQDYVLPEIDGARVGTVGHSLGGAAAFDACRQDGGFDACINLDGFSVGPVTSEGVGASALTLKAVPRYSDDDHARRGRTRAEWDAMVRDTRPLLIAPLQRVSSQPAFLVEIHGTGHLSFSDAPFVMPTTITRFGGDILTPQRTHAVMSTIVRAFLDDRLRGEDDTWVGLDELFREVVVERITP